VLVDENLNMTCQYMLAAQKANRILGCIKRILPLCSGKTPHGVLCSALGPQHRNDMQLLKWIQRSREVILPLYSAPV